MEMILKETFTDDEIDKIQLYFNIFNKSTEIFQFLEKMEGN